MEKIKKVEVGSPKKVKTNKNILLKLSLVAINVTVGLQTSTQYFAHKFNYHPSLGGSNHIYAPWKILEWGYKWGDQYQDAFYQSAAPGVIVSALGILGMSMISVISANSSKPNEYLHGSARWATKKDIQAAGLLPKDGSWFKKNKMEMEGVYVGAWVDPFWERSRVSYSNFIIVAS